MALGAGLVGWLLRCWRAAAQLGGADFKAGVLGSLSCELSILLLAGECLVPAVLGMDRGVAVSPAPRKGNVWQRDRAVPFPGRAGCREAALLWLVPSSAWPSRTLGLPRNVFVSLSRQM